MAGFFSCFVVTRQYNGRFHFDAYLFPWSHLGTIICPLVQSHKKRLQRPNISELAALEMRQSGHLMVKMKVYPFHYSYTCAGFQPPSSLLTMGHICTSLPTKKCFPRRSSIRRVGIPGFRLYLDVAYKSQIGDVAPVQATAQFSHSRPAQDPLT